MRGGKFYFDVTKALGPSSDVIKKLDFSASSAHQEGEKGGESSMPSAAELDLPASEPVPISKRIFHPHSPPLPSTFYLSLNFR